MKRVLLKLSGEALAGEKRTGFDEATCIGVAKQVKQLVDDGVQVAIVTGGGNFWRGRTSETIDRVKADQIGMLATVMNCIYVSDIFRFAGMETEVFTPFVCGAFTTLFSKDKAVEALNQISIQEIIDKKLMAVDLTASIMCLENKMPMLVFGLNEPNSIVETMSGTFTGTKVTV